MFFSKGVGLLAAFLHAFLPVDVRYGTFLYPDPAAALWLNAAILMIYVGSKSPIGLRKTVLGGFAGLALGLSWLSKEAVLFSLPFVAGYLLWVAYQDSKNSALAAAAAGAFGVVVGIEAAVLHLVSRQSAPSLPRDRAPQP